MIDTEKYLIAVKYLDGLFGFFNEKLFKGELKKPVITVQLDARNTRSGWLTRERVWKDGNDGAYELNVSAQGLNKPIAEIAADLLHEMCHYYARLRDLKDCDLAGRYHNKLFQKICVLHGLDVSEIKGRGYAKTSLTCDSGHLLKKYTDKNPPELIYRAQDKKGLPVKVNSVRKYVCPLCGIKVKATRAVNLICADCGEFLIEEINEI